MTRIVYPSGKDKEQGGARKHRLDLTGNQPATTSHLPVARLASVKIGSGPAKQRSAQPGEAGRSVGSVLRKGDVMTAHSAERRSRHGTTSKAGATAISAVSNATAGPVPKVCLRYGIARAGCDIKSLLAASEASPVLLRRPEAQRLLMSWQGRRFNQTGDLPAGVSERVEGTASARGADRRAISARHLLSAAVIHRVSPRRGRRPPGPDG